MHQNMPISQWKKIKPLPDDDVKEGCFSRKWLFYRY